MGKLFVISGSSGVGKGTVIKEFLKRNPDFKLSVSCTTRAPREGEKHGENYFFLSKEEFVTCVEKGEFLEWAEFSGNMYGTKRPYVDEKLALGKNLILEIDTKGALNVKKIMPEATLIFILPPSLEELERRLVGRGTEVKEVVKARIAAANREIDQKDCYTYAVVNDSIDRAANEIEEILSK